MIKETTGTYYIWTLGRNKALWLNEITEGESIIIPGMSESELIENMDDIFKQIESIQQKTDARYYLHLYYNRNTEGYSVIFYPQLRKSASEITDPDVFRAIRSLSEES